MYYRKTLRWKTLTGVGLLGHGKTAPRDGEVCLLAFVDGERTLIDIARFERRALIGRFVWRDGSYCYPWEVSSWMRAKPVLDFIRPRCKIIPFPGCPAGQVVTQ